MDEIIALRYEIVLTQWMLFLLSMFATASSGGLCLLFFINRRWGLAPHLAGYLIVGSVFMSAQFSFNMHRIAHIIIKIEEAVRVQGYETLKVLHPTTAWASPLLSGGALITSVFIFIVSMLMAWDAAMPTRLGRLYPRYVHSWLCPSLLAIALYALKSAPTWARQ
jgi:hypothetical protein